MLGSRTHVVIMVAVMLAAMAAAMMLMRWGGRSHPPQAAAAADHSAALGRRTIKRHHMFGSDYNSVMQSDAVKSGWAPWGDVDAILKMRDKATYTARSCPR
jgi:hypothetical protein